MCCPFTRLAVGLVTFLVGVGLALVWPSPRAETHLVVGPSLDIDAHVNAPDPLPVERVESDEEKAVRLAEEFVARNGYTDLPAGRDNLSYESLEGAGDDEGLLEMRRNTLERRAYGVIARGRPGVEGGWTIAFRYNKDHLGAPGGCFRMRRTGRAVTMDRDFRLLRVEHQDIFLDKVEKKL